MSLRLLLDEHISPRIAPRIREIRPNLDIVSIFTWRGGTFIGASDKEILDALNEESRLLVTYDTQILAELPDLFDSDGGFSGIVFIDHKTIAPSDMGGIIRSIVRFVDEYGGQSWFRRISFLERAINETP